MIIVSWQYIVLDPATYSGHRVARMKTVPLVPDESGQHYANTDATWNFHGDATRQHAGENYASSPKSVPA